MSASLIYSVSSLMHKQLIEYALTACIMQCFFVVGLLSIQHMTYMLHGDAACSTGLSPTLTPLKTFCRIQFETTQVVTQKYKTQIFINCLVLELMCGGCCRRMEFKLHLYKEGH